MPQETSKPAVRIRPRSIVHLLGTESVDSVLSMQRRLIYELESTGDVGLILCEHDTELTIGRRGSLSHLRAEDESDFRLETLPRFVSRGGGCWLHRPGQVAGYLIGDLKSMACSVEDYMARLETSLIETLADFDVRAECGPGHRGLFAGGKRIAALGLAVTRNMAHFGFLLNVGPHLRPFDMIVEPGPEGRPIRQTSLESIRGRPVEPFRLRSRLVLRIRESFDLEPGPVFSPTHELSFLPEAGEFHVCG